MAKLTMRLVDGPLADDAKVVTSMDSRTRPVLSGGGRTTLRCGSCAFPVARRIDPESVRGLVLRCPRCHRDNALPV